MPPYRLVYQWPTPEDALSDSALAKLRDFGPNMRDALDHWWYGSGSLPKEAHSMACQVAQWDRGITDTPFTSMPEPNQVLSPEIVKLYEKFSERGQEVFTRQLGFNVLKGEVTFKRGRFGLNEQVSSFNSTPEEFLEGLRIWSDRWVAEWACNVEHLGYEHFSSITQLQPR